MVADWSTVDYAAVAVVVVPATAVADADAAETTIATDATVVVVVGAFDGVVVVVVEVAVAVVVAVDPLALASSPRLVADAEQQPLLRRQHSFHDSFAQPPASYAVDWRSALSSATLMIPFWHRRRSAALTSLPNATCDCRRCCCRSNSCCSCPFASVSPERSCTEWRPVCARCRRPPGTSAFG